MNRNLVLLAIGLVVLLPGVFLGWSPRTPSKVLAQGQLAGQIPCGTYYAPAASYDPIAGETFNPPHGMRDAACAAKNPAAWTLLAWAATIAGAVLLVAGVALASVGAGSRGATRRL